MREGAKDRMIEYFAFGAHPYIGKLLLVRLKFFSFLSSVIQSFRSSETWHPHPVAEQVEVVALLTS
jgi:hypothetical protein